MSTIRVVWGSATGPTAMASYDAALADANCHDYNLVRLSSVIPEDTPVERVGTAPDLGPAGNRLAVVEARATVTEGQAVAGLGWATSESEHGVFYETAGETENAVRETLETGVRSGCALRGWSEIDPEIVTRTATAVESPSPSPLADGGGTESRRIESGGDHANHPDDSEYATAVVLAAYGRSNPIV